MRYTGGSGRRREGTYDNRPFDIELGECRPHATSDSAAMPRARGLPHLARSRAEQRAAAPAASDAAPAAQPRANQAARAASPPPKPTPPELDPQYTPEQRLLMIRQICWSAGRQAAPVRRRSRRAGRLGRQMHRGQAQAAARPARQPIAAGVPPPRRAAGINITASERLHADGTARDNAPMRTVGTSAMRFAPLLVALCCVFAACRPRKRRTRAADTSSISAPGPARCGATPSSSMAGSTAAAASARWRAPASIPRTAAPD